MIIPGALMGVTDYVYVAGVAANPDSITAVLYRWVGATRSASGITVTCTSVGSGEYRFTWTNDSGFARTDELELVALPVVDSVTYPATVWRSHGAVDAVMRGTDSAATPTNVTDAQTAILAKLPSALVGGRMDSSVGAVATGAIAAASFAANALDAVWSTSARSLTTFGSLVADVVSGVWAAATRTITGTVTLATSQPNYAPAKAGDAMALTSGERSTLAGVLEAAILDEGDATALLAAIAAKVEEFLINEGDATATIAAIATACNAAIAAGTVGTNAATAATQASSANTKLGTPAGDSVSADIVAVKADTAAILLDTGTDGVVVATASKTGYALSSAGVRSIWTDDWFEIEFLNTTPGGYLQALDTANDTTSASLSAIDLWVKRNAVILSGLVTGAGTGTEVFTISTLSITATVTVDGDGNRSALVWS